MLTLGKQPAKVEGQRTFVAHLMLEGFHVKTVKLLGLAGLWAALLAGSAGTANSAGRDIYPDPSQARSDLAAALKTASANHKRVLIDFGGNWCGDCQVLDLYFHDPANLP